MSKVGMYKHLNQDDTVPFSIPETAKTVLSLNYGAQRFLSEIVEQRKADERYERLDNFKRRTDQLEELLNDGWY